MKMKALSAALSVATLAGLVVAAQAATLNGMQGQVLVNRGGGYQFVSGSVELKPGDMIIANAGGSATLSYGDGCSVTVQAGSVVTVQQQSPCASQTNNGTQGGVPPGTLAIGAVVIGGGVAAAVLMGGNSDKAASP